MNQDNIEGKLIEGRYLIDREIGRGGFSIVYEAIHVPLQEKRVIKRLKPEKADSWRQFGLEGRVMSYLQRTGMPIIEDLNVVYAPDESNVIKLLQNYPLKKDLPPDYSADDIIYMAFHYADAISLSDYVKLNGNMLPETEARYIGMKICEIADHLHRNGIAHFDIKPDNILISLTLPHDENVMLSDFGAARALGSVNPYPVCTPLYMPNEFLRNPGSYEIKSQLDIFSIGATIFEILGGSLPASIGSNFLDIQFYRPQVSNTMARAVNVALSNQESKRWNSAEDMMLELSRGRIKKDFSISNANASLIKGSRISTADPAKRMQMILRNEGFRRAQQAYGFQQ